MDIDVLHKYAWDVIGSALNRYGSQCYLNTSSISMLRKYVIICQRISKVANSSTSGALREIAISRERAEEKHSS